MFLPVGGSAGAEAWRCWGALTPGRFCCLREGARGLVAWWGYSCRQVPLLDLMLLGKALGCTS